MVMKNTEICIYEKIILFKKIPYWLYYPILGLGGFLLGDAIIRAFGEKRYFWTQITFASYIGIVPVIIIWGSYKFQNILRELAPILWRQHDEFESWLQSKVERVFSLASFPSKIITLFVIVLGIFTIFMVGLPFKSQIVNLMAAIGFFIVLFVCGQSAYLLIALLVTLREIVQRPPELPFFLLSHPAIINLQNFYSTVAICVTLGYISLIFALWYGPYGLSLEMQIWLTLLAFYPIILFSWSFLQIRNLMRKIKFLHVQMVNNSLQEMIVNLGHKNQLDDLKSPLKIL
jgi:hypothetical protein